MTNGDETYFEAYCNLEVHEKMLNDVHRNEAYRKAIITNEDYLKDKIVLDLGAGTGFLSVLCAKAGAVKVYAVEASDIVSVTKKIIEENQVQHIVEIIKGRIEDIQLPQQVDVIISEWMGFYLFHEGMLDSVISARDKFLKKDGVIFPDRCELFAAPCRLPSFSSCWNNVSGVAMNTFAKEFRKSYHGKPKIMAVPAEDLLTDSNRLTNLSLKYVTSEELDNIYCKFFAISKTNNQFEGVCLWFTVTFPALTPGSQEVILSTSCDSPLTHWYQTVIVLQEKLEIEKNNLIIGSVILKRSKENPRFYDIEFEIFDSELEEHPMPCGCCNVRCKIIKTMSEQYDERDESIINEND